VLLCLLPASAHAAKIKYTYDAAGRLVAEDYGGGKVTTYNYDPNGNLRTNITAVAASADVRITSLSGSLPAAAGSPITYTIVVTNTGPEVATAVVLTDPLPLGIIATGANATQGSCETAGRVVTCQLGALLPGRGATISLTGLRAIAGSFTNVVTVTSAVSDPNPANNVTQIVSTATASADNDSDGMPNWWETLYFGSAFAAVATVDSDLDGARNLDEWLADTNPQDAASLFAITEAVYEAATGVFTLRFQSSPARRYRAQFTPQLGAAFADLLTVDGSGATLSISHTNATGGFYRLQAELP